MHRLIVLHPLPDDPSAFRRYYQEVHMPIAALTPGMLACRYQFDVKGFGSGPSNLVCVYEADFPDEDAMKKAFTTREGLAVLQDVANLPTRLHPQVFHFKVENYRPDGSLAIGCESRKGGA
ncbi:MULTISPECIES: EthD family reductase [Paraburkholderia]|uniref:EthD family reductase n=1 Tax=Paraburkholderia TaxID=1822464 RepID=UPI0005AAB8FB|nr:EthD family reductase [Paraburkholderia ferrariae]